MTNFIDRIGLWEYAFKFLPESLRAFAIAMAGVGTALVVEAWRNTGDTYDDPELWLKAFGAALLVQVVTWLTGRKPVA